MSDDPRHPPESDPKIGTFMAPDGLFGVPLRNLSDEIPSGDPKPKAARRPNRLRRTLDRLLHGGH
jgi:hypothetical protein